MKKYFSFLQDDQEAHIYIYGDITSWPWLESDVSSYILSVALEKLVDVETIHVYINSYGGEVSEGLAIYNALKRHKAKVITHADGFACSIASVIFAAGDERIMSNASLLMIHNAWMFAAGNADELRKQAADLETISQASVNAYMDVVSISENKLKKLMNEESWITPQDALDMGFATSVTGGKISEKASQSIRKAVFDMLTRKPVIQEEAVGGDGIELEGTLLSRLPESQSGESLEEKATENIPKRLFEALLR